VSAEQHRNRLSRFLAAEWRQLVRTVRSWLADTAFALAFGWFVMLLWNWLMPAIFGLGAITYWQAFGLVVLAKLIFGAVGPADTQG